MEALLVPFTTITTTTWRHDYLRISSRLSEGVLELNGAGQSVDESLKMNRTGVNWSCWFFLIFQEWHFRQSQDSVEFLALYRFKATNKKLCNRRLKKGREKYWCLSDCHTGFYFFMFIFLNRLFKNKMKEEKKKKKSCPKKRKKAILLQACPA